MAITQIQVLVPGAGTAVVPSPGDYDEVSDGWEEVEHRARWPGRDRAGFDGCRHTLEPTRKIFVGVSAR
ncbi:hypothetical protein [Nonomuraea bangladeshensis]|uniref:hypothetical protein n=1 Tax=Nonomuraea bangladeshensis TaxID=404385 RepID=UPI0031E1F86D